MAQQKTCQYRVAMLSRKKRSAALKGTRSRRTRAPVAFATPMAAETVQALPEGAEWSYELKFDGYRALVLKDLERIEIRSRNDKVLTRTYPSVAAAAARVPAATAVIDGEIVAFDSSGRPSFQSLQQRTADESRRIVFYAFDLLHLNGESLVDQPLTTRRAALEELIADSGLLLSEELPGTAAEVVRSIRKLGLEGVIAKRRESRYIPGERSSDWQKLKLENQQEFVIGGFRPAGRSVDALVVGYFEDGKLRCAGKVRAGFIPHTRRELYEKLAPLHTPICPFADLPVTERSRWGGGITAEEMKTFRWVKVKLVAQIRFVEWTGDGRLRLAKYLGLRSDKTPADVRRESARARS